jgi:ribosomal protein S18 acetylase RimI-like enzyme
VASSAGLPICFLERKLMYSSRPIAISMSTVHYRPPRLDDDEWLVSVLADDLALSLELEGYEEDTDGCRRTASSTFDQLRSQRTPGSILVAEGEDGQRAGMIWAIQTKDENSGSDQAFILDLHVEKGCRGMGIGNELLTRAEEWARERGLPIIALAVSEGNEVARRLYERIGFITRRRVMSKSL